MTGPCCLYSTHKHTPEASRLRLVIPLEREVSEDEYPALGRMVAKEIGIDMFDDTTYEPSAPDVLAIHLLRRGVCVSGKGRCPARSGHLSLKICRLAGRLHVANLETAVGGNPAQPEAAKGSA